MNKVKMTVTALLLCCGLFLATNVWAVFDPFELNMTGQTTLSAENQHQSFEDLVPTMSNLIAFDYWYTPDAIFTMTGSPWSIVTQKYFLTGPGDQLGAHPELVVYRPSTEWATCVVNSPFGLWNICMTPYCLFGSGYMDMINGCHIDDALLGQLPQDYIVNNQLTVKNFRGYDSFSDYLADVREDDHNGNDVQPVPEPSSFVMLGTAMLGLIGYKFRKA